MSVINQMLQDLEKRRAGASEGAALPNQVRPLPAARETVARPALAGAGAAALVAIAAGVAIWWWAKSPAPAAKPAIVVSAVPAPEAKVAAAPAPAPQVPRVAPVRPVPVTPNPLPPSAAPAKTAPVTAPATAPVSAKGLRLSPDLSLHPVTPEKTGAAAPASMQVAPKAEVVAKAEPPAKIETVARSDSAAKPRAEMTPGSIDKQMRPVTPRERADADYRRATSALSQGRSAEAEQALRTALTEDPTYDAARQTMVGMLVEQKRSDEALKLLQDALTARPNHLGFAMLLARLQLDRGDSTGALATMARTQPYALDNADFLGFSAALLQRAGRHAEAAEQYRNALRVRPDSAVWWMGLGISLQAVDRNADALDAYRRALSTGSLSSELQGFVEQRIKQVAP